MTDKMKVYLKLFASTFYLSAFTFGGGFVIIPLMKKRFVDELGWIDETEMLNLIAIAQSSPGAVAVNASILIGYRIAGFWGAMLTILGTITPPLIILSVVSLFYAAFRDNLYVNVILKGMQAGVAAVIADVVINMGTNVVKQKKVLPVLIMLAAFTAVFFFDVNVMYIILVCGLLGALMAIFGTKTGKEQTGA